MLRQKRFLERLQPRMAFLSTLWVKHFVPRRKHLGRTLGDVTILAVESRAVLMTVVYSHHKDLTRVGVTITVGPSTLQQKTSKPLRIPLKTYQAAKRGGDHQTKGHFPVRQHRPHSRSGGCYTLTWRTNCSVFGWNIGSNWLKSSASAQVFASIPDQPFGPSGMTAI